MLVPLVLLLVWSLRRRRLLLLRPRLLRPRLLLVLRPRLLRPRLRLGLLEHGGVLLLLLPHRRLLLLPQRDGWCPRDGCRRRRRHRRC